jgi:hypothetical protein
MEPWRYLRDLFYLLPDWPKARVPELAPAYFEQTLQETLSCGSARIRSVALSSPSLAELLIAQPLYGATAQLVRTRLPERIRLKSARALAPLLTGSWVTPFCSTRTVSATLEAPAGTVDLYATHFGSTPELELEAKPV